jgi:alanyl aminopeptidase
MKRHTPLIPLAPSLCVLLIASCASTPASNGSTVVAPQESKPLAPKDTSVGDEPSPGFRLPADTRPVDYALHFDLDPNQETFTGTARIRVQLDKARKAVWLHARDLNVTSASIDGKPARFKQVDDDGMARVAVDAPVGPGEVTVELAWSAKYNASLESVYRAQFEGAWYVFTQFEAIMARESFPCFDEPGFKAPFTLSFTTKKGDVVFANTDPSSTEALAAERTKTTFAKTQPLPTYLLAWAVGPLEVVEHTAKVGATRIRGIAAKGKTKELAVSLDVHAKALASLEKYFGIPYPYGKLDFVAVPDFAAGAMENAGLVTYRDSLLFINKDSPIGMQKANAHVVAHELAHQWFGNYVTLAWWDDIWLNEAFASWAQTFVVNEIRAELNATVDARSSADWVMGEDSLVSARQVRQPVLSKGDIINAFDGITYTKGAAVIGMFEALVGKDAFRAGVQQYMKDHAHGTATSSALMKALDKASGKDVSTAFNTFLEQPGVPFVQAKVTCGKDGANTLEVTQSRYLPVGSTGDIKKTWHVPVCARVGKETVCNVVTSATGAVTLPKSSTCPKVVMPNSDGIGYFRWSLPGDQLKPLAASLKSLSAGERISFANAVRASAWAGQLSFADALGAAAPLARDVESAVANTPFQLYAFAWSELVEVEARPKVMKALADAYRPVLDEVKMMPPKGKTEDPRVRERRGLALSALMLAEDVKVMSALAKLGDAALAGTGEGAGKRVNLDAVPGDLASKAIAASIKAGGAKKWNEAAALLSTETDSMARSYLLGGLGGVEDAALGKKALALSLDPRLKVNEVTSPLWGQISDPRTRDAAWAWARENMDAILARVPESASGEIMPNLAGGACSEDAATDLEKYVREKSKGKDLPGLDRALAQQTEGMRLCAARKKVHQESARKLFPK